MVVGLYFNFDLLSCVPLPGVSAVYELRAELGERGDEGFLESNRVTIELGDGGSHHDRDADAV